MMEQVPGRIALLIALVFVIAINGALSDALNSGCRSTSPNCCRRTNGSSRSIILICIYLFVRCRAITILRMQVD
jgi:hypothetical protein